MVELLHLHKAHAAGPPVFQDTSVRIERGDIVCLTGPGGIGKTTFLKLIMGQERPDSGIVLVEERNVHSLEQTAHLDEKDSALVMGLFRQENMAGATIVLTAQGAQTATMSGWGGILEVHDGRVVDRSRAG